MSAAWSWYLVVGTVGSLLASFWLIVWTNRQRSTEEEIRESEHHVWDEDIRELNNPLPMWWLWLFVITLVWGAAYFVMYPAFGNYDGVLGWTQEKQYERQMAAAEDRYGPLFAQYGSTPVEELAQNPDALDMGRSLYANYCSQCHGANALGAPGFPNLTDDVWNWGGSPRQIEQTIMNGRTGIMPALGAIFPNEQAVGEMVIFVRNLSESMDTSSPAHARYMQQCVACHGPEGQGNQALGAPSLTDDVWLYGSSPAAVRHSITRGRTGQMPAHADFLGEDKARILAAYVYSLSQ